ncbi:MAG TPA: polysaccharide biosynthesis/export family protein, partial [Verrucomicrobiae bacterium]
HQSCPALYGMSARWAMALVGILALCAGCNEFPPQKPADWPPPVSPHMAPGPLSNTKPSGPLAPPPTAGPVPETITITNQLDPALLNPPTNFFTLGPGDRLEIQLLGNPATKTTTMVAPDGKLYYDLLPGIDVWGLTLSQARSQLEHAYSKYVRTPPQISIVLREVASKHIWILGRVQAPGIYPMTGPTTLLEALSEAGGSLSLTSYQDQDAAGVGAELADLQRSFVVRNGKLLPVDFSRLLAEGDMSQNIYLQPDDFIYLPSAVAQDVYVLGAVTEPRLVAFHTGMTVAGAVAGAYGTLKEAYLSHVVVVRGSLSRPKVTVVDLKRALQGETNDVAVLPGDIVYVPLSPYRYINHYIDIILNTFVSSVAINEGTRVVGQPQSGVTGVFIPVGSGIQVIPPAATPPIQ